ncbi:MAG: NADH-quinone oxidoreductase subunit NuoE [Planctomycetota bacterium]|nr:NADH-quinone oxidoreductase subunit NuoE [Planctomycetota bacterium]
MSSGNRTRTIPRDLLIPLLQEAQERDGFISRDSVNEISEKLNIPPAKVYGVASFYNQFTFSKPGKYIIRVCRGTACHVKGSERILNALQAELKISPGETTRDGLFSLDEVACLGACGLAPVILVNGKFHGRLTVKDVAKVIESYRAKEEEGQK